MFIVTSSVPWMENFATVSDKFFIGVTMTLLGVSIVVLVLALISLFVSFLSRLINSGTKSAKSGKQQSAAVPVPTKAVAVKAEPEPEIASMADSGAGPTDQQALIAVLAAAVAAFSADAAPRSSAGFIIRRVRRV